MVASSKSKAKSKPGTGAGTNTSSKTTTRSLKTNLEEDRDGREEFGGGVTTEERNLEIFKECLAPVIYRKWKLAVRDGGRHSVGGGGGGGRKGVEHDDGDGDGGAEELSEFIEYLASEIFPSLPPAFRSAKYSSSTTTPPPDPSSLPLDTLPLTFADTLTSYSIAPDPSSVHTLLNSVLTDYITAATAPPPPWASTRTTSCEICDRDGGGLTYHHLIPKSVHAKVLKRGWHEEHMLNSVAWLCRPCHSMVHRVARCEELAKEFYTVERLLGREDIRRWAEYISKQRWAVKRG